MDLDKLLGVPIIESPHLAEDTVLVLHGSNQPGGYPSAGYPQVVIGIRPLTEVELAGRWAKWFVRKGFDDAGLLPAGIKVGKEPLRNNPNAMEMLAEAAIWGGR